MATVITEECINCGACEPECPNTAIYQGDVAYEWQGAEHTALSREFFYIVPEKCTECVGFFDQEACAAVCPVDCCIPDPARPESEADLLVRAKEIHPDKTFGADFPSRFKESGGASAAPAAAAVAPTAGTPATPAAPAAAPAVAAVATALPTGTRVEKPVKPPKRVLAQGDPTHDFEGELTDPFDDVIGRVAAGGAEPRSLLLGLVLLALSPGLGALGNDTKLSIENAYGDRRFFSREGSTALNILHNFLLYPAVGFFVGILSGVQPFTEGDKGWIVLGILFALGETALRLKDGFRGIPVEKISMGPSFYGAPLSFLLASIVARMVTDRESGRVPVEGFYSDEFESKLERERRYGEVYTVQSFEEGYYVRFELPSAVPPSGVKEDLNIGDTMPDYELDVSLDGDELIVAGRVVDENLRRVSAVSSAFPPDFRTPIELGGPLTGFRHRYADKVLEVVVLRQAG